MPRLDIELRYLADATSALRTQLPRAHPVRQRLTDIADSLHALARRMGEILDRFDVPQRQE